MMRRYSFLPAALIVLFAPAAAWAHTGIGGGFGFVNGLVHPFLGLDHLLAMTAVGFWAAQLGGRAKWLVPAAFVGVMAAAGGIAMMGLTLPFIEAGIAASVFVLGLAITLRFKLTPPLAMALVGAFAAFHGFAHGAEVPHAATPILYAAGFVISTAVLHGIGVGLGLIARNPWAYRLGGAAVAAAGMFFLIVS